MTAQIEWQPLSPIIRLFCAIMSLGGFVPIALGVFAIEREGWDGLYLMLVLSGIVCIPVFGYGAIAGRFPR